MTRLVPIALVSVLLAIGASVATVWLLVGFNQDATTRGEGTGPAIAAGTQTIGPAAGRCIAWRGSACRGRGCLARCRAAQARSRIAATARRRTTRDEPGRRARLATC